LVVFIALASKKDLSGRSINDRNEFRFEISKIAKNKIKLKFLWLENNDYFILLA